MVHGRPLLHAVVGRYAASAWGVEIDRVKAAKGNAFMRIAAARMAVRDARWADFPVPAIRCAPIEEVRRSVLGLLGRRQSQPGTQMAGEGQFTLERAFLRRNQRYVGGTDKREAWAPSSSVQVGRRGLPGTSSLLQDSGRRMRR